ncbi:MAG: hypothetical protein RIT04_113 [Candidatus Parcubacteria bacterium]|jgi:hypothetical protein
MKIKRFVVDMVALNLFVIFTALIVEVLISGIPWSIFWKGRLVMIIPNIITVEPYNWTRVWIGKRIGIWKFKKLHDIFRDTIVFILYRVPLIFIVLLLLGTSWQKVLSVCIVATLASGFTGRPYGIFLDWFRKLFKITN